MGDTIFTWGALFISFIYFVSLNSLKKMLQEVTILIVVNGRHLWLGDLLWDRASALQGEEATPECSPTGLTPAPLD